MPAGSLRAVTNGGRDDEVAVCPGCGGPALSQPVMAYTADAGWSPAKFVIICTAGQCNTGLVDGFVETS